jgi:cellulose synthase/poly-beta-1,6-N-acetylglucosamine synthase-like glycosyltransferase
MQLLLTSLDWLNATVLIYFVAFNAFYLLTTLVAHRALLRYARRLKTVDVEDLLGSAAAPPISLLVPGYNEELTCVESVRSLLTLRYHAFEIMFINDGSTDQTLARMVDAFDLEPVQRAPVSNVPSRAVRGAYRSRRHPALWVLDKENGGSKADALNAGLAYCRTPLFCAIDADSLLERDALMRIVRPFLEDRSTIAAGGIIRIINGSAVRAGVVSDVKLPRSLLACFQVLEYLRSFLAGRVGWAELKGTLVISGAFGAFDCATVVAAGGYDSSSVGEDMELVVRLHRYCRERGIRYRIEYIPDPVAWTECPEEVATLARQRRRWQRGLTETLWIHRRMLLRPTYGAVGMLAFPFNFFFEMLAPAIEIAAYLGFLVGILLGRVSPLHALDFFLAAFVLGIVLSVAAIALEEQTFRRYPRRRDLAGLFALAIFEVLGYRQLNAWWRIQGMWAAISGTRGGWGVMKRKGFAAP